MNNNLQQQVIIRMYDCLGNIEHLSYASSMIEELNSLEKAITAKVNIYKYNNWKVSEHVENITKIISNYKPNNLTNYEKTVNSDDRYYWMFTDWFNKLKESFEYAITNDYAVAYILDHVL